VWIAKKLNKLSRWERLNVLSWIPKMMRDESEDDFEGGKP
jgi:hypothetical protein